MGLSAFIDECESALNEADLFDRLCRHVAGLGADLLSYHLMAEHLLHIELEEGFAYHCFPQAWVDRYVERNYFAIDPIIEASMTSREPFKWYEVGDRVKLTREQQAYLEDLRAQGMVDGYAIPVYSSAGSAGYFGVGSSRRTLDLRHGDLLELQFACLHVHNVLLDIRGGSPAPSAALSPREREVLTLIAGGRTNTAIAEMLGVSESTIDTLVRRTFAKLGVNDRVSAALKAVGMGAIRL
jgi:DNA-binding CsgD family transcriptional regulator